MYDPSVLSWLFTLIIIRRNPLGMRVSSVLCEVCFNTSQGFLVGYFIIGWLVSDIAPGAKQWDVQLENLGSFLYVCGPVSECFPLRS